MIRFDIITIFPSVFAPVLNESIIKRAQEKKKVQIRVYDLRAYSRDKHKKVDDRPFGGGPGMVMTPQPLFDAVKKIKGRRKAKVLLMCPGGTPLTQTKARALARERNLILICGHYEGVDERVRRMVVDESLSVGDYILTGGELPAMIVVDAVTRLIPGVLGKEASLDWKMSRLKEGCLSIRIIPARRIFVGPKCRKSCCQGIMRILSDGDRSKR